MGYANSYKGFGDLSEKEYKSKIITDLKRDFVVKEEYWGTHFSGQKVRIDAVFRPKNTDLWMNKKIVFGLEFKSPAKLKQLGKQLAFTKQAIDYSNTIFDKLGYIPVLICPRIDFDTTYSHDKAPYFMRKLLNQFNVGELDYTHRGLSILFSDSEFIYTSTEGVKKGKSSRLITNFGSK